MSSILIDYYPIFELYQSLRAQLMEILSDKDLGFSPGGGNLPLGVLCREIGEVEYSYIQSFKTFKQEFSYRNPEPGLQSSVEKLSTWFAELDHELKSTVGSLSEEDLQQRKIDRGGNFRLAPRVQLEVYKEALLIFYGKADVYLKALGKDLPEQWQEWIG